MKKKTTIVVLALLVLAGGLIYLLGEREVSLTSEKGQAIIAQERKNIPLDELRILEIVDKADRISKIVNNPKMLPPKIEGGNIKSEVIRLSDNPGSYVEFEIIRQEEGETEEGYVKEVRIRGYPAIEIHNRVNNESQIQVLVKDSYILKVEATRSASPQVLRAYAEKAL